MKADYEGCLTMAVHAIAAVPCDWPTLNAYCVANIINAGAHHV